LDETSAEAHTALALVQFSHDWDWSGAERSVTRALELNPGYADARYLFAHLLGHIGQLERGILEIRKARELDPLHPRLNANVGRMLYWARRYDEAMEDLQAVVAADPGNMAAHINLAEVYAKTGRYDEALAECATIHRLAPGGHADVFCPLYVDAATGRKREARTRLAELRQDPKILLYRVSLVYAMLGDKEDALAVLERAYNERASGLQTVNIEPPFDLLRDDPRFQALLRRMNFPEN